MPFVFKVWMLGKNTILKAIHNWHYLLIVIALVWMLGKNTILKAIHNYALGYWILDWVWMLGKNTILKAIHNRCRKEQRTTRGVNAG